MAAWARRLFWRRRPLAPCWCAPGSSSAPRGTAARIGVILALGLSLASATAWAGVEPAGWYAGDPRVHRSCGGAPVSVSSIDAPMVAEDLAVVSLLADMGNGEVLNPVTDLPLVTGLDDPILGLGEAHQVWEEYRYPNTFDVVVTDDGAMLQPVPAMADVFVGFTPSTITVAPGDTFTATIAILEGGSEFNAFDASVRFDPARLSFVPTSPVANQRGELMTSACASTFHQFNPAPDSLKITLSLLCSHTSVTGPGTIYRVRFQAGSTPGTTTLSLGPFTEFYRAGLFVRPSHKQDLVVTIQGTTGVDPRAGSGRRLHFAPLVPNPWHGRDSIRLDFVLPAPDLVSFDVLDVQGRRLAGRDAVACGGGQHRISWSPPPLPNGSYLVRLNTRSGGSAVQRWVVLR